MLRPSAREVLEAPPIRPRYNRRHNETRYNRRHNGPEMRPVARAGVEVRAREDGFVRSGAKPVGNPDAHRAPHQARRARQAPRCPCFGLVITVVITRLVITVVITSPRRWTGSPSCGSRDCPGSQAQRIRAHRDRWFTRPASMAIAAPRQAWGTTPDGDPRASRAALQRHAGPLVDPRPPPEPYIVMTAAITVAICAETPRSCPADSCGRAARGSSSHRPRCTTSARHRRARRFAIRSRWSSARCSRSTRNIRRSPSYSSTPRITSIRAFPGHRRGFLGCRVFPASTLGSRRSSPSPEQLPPDSKRTRDTFATVVHSPRRASRSPPA